MEAAKDARLQVSGARRPRVAEQLESARSARLEVSGARRPRGRRAAGGCKGCAARSERRGVRSGQERLGLGVNPLRLLCACYPRQCHAMAVARLIRERAQVLAEQAGGHN